MRFKSPTTAAALALSAALLASPASAITINLGTLDAGGSSIGNSFWRYFSYGSPLGAFSDSFTFSLSGAADALGGTTMFEFQNLDLSLSSVSLSGGTLPSTVVDRTPDAFSFYGLGAGPYTLTVNGSLGGGSGVAGYYGNIRTGVSRISEPGSLALLAASLGLLGYWGRRR